MGILQVRLFGGVHLTNDNWQTEISITREVQALLAYLLLYRRSHSREILADIFWGEYNQEKARGSLNTAIWKLKKVLEPKGVPSGKYLKNSHQSEIAFNRESQYWLDVEIFENELSRVLIYSLQTVKENDIAGLEKTLGLYKGDLLEGYYEDWALRERERLRTLYLKGLSYLLQYYGFRRVYERAITYGQRILDTDPFREDIHREMMKLYLENGQRIMALRQYKNCCKALEEEFGVSPMEETKQLYREILTKDNHSPAHTVSIQRIDIDQAFHKLTEVTQTLDFAKEQIQQLLELIASQPK